MIEDKYVARLKSPHPQAHRSQTKQQRNRRSHGKQSAADHAIILTESPRTRRGGGVSPGNLGFEGGHVLENSAGIGHVLGLAPDDVAENSRLTACELDSITGRMLKMLYPQATVHVMGFQDAKID